MYGRYYLKKNALFIQKEGVEMKRHAIARMFGAMKLDPPVIIGCMEMVSSGSYEKAFNAFLNASNACSMYWEQTVQFYVLVAAYNPRASARWIDAVVKKLCSGDVRVPETFCQGVTIGLLEAGVWLDKQGHQTSFQEKVLSGIAMLTNEGRVDKEQMSDGQWEVDHERFSVRLGSVMEAFLSPNQEYRPFRFGAQSSNENAYPSDSVRRQLECKRKEIAQEVLRGRMSSEARMFWGNQFFNCLHRLLPPRWPHRTTGRHSRARTW